VLRRLRTRRCFLILFIEKRRSTLVLHLRAITRKLCLRNVRRNNLIKATRCTRSSLTNVNNVIPVCIKFNLHLTILLTLANLCFTLASSRKWQGFIYLTAKYATVFAAALDTVFHRKLRKFSHSRDIRRRIQAIVLGNGRVISTRKCQRRIISFNCTSKAAWRRRAGNFVGSRARVNVDNRQATIASTLPQATSTY